MDGKSTKSREDKYEVRNHPSRESQVQYDGGTGQKKKVTSLSQAPNFGELIPNRLAISS